MGQCANRLGSRRTQSATGANVTGARRLTPGSNLAFVVTVAPSVDTDVTLTVRGTDDCAAPHAVCRGDGRKLVAGASATIAMGAPIAVTVADTEVEEAEGATLDFVVSMDRAAAHDIEIWYRTYDGTATAGADYVAVSSSFTMTAGETTKTVSVSVLDDAHDEGAETVKFWLSGVRGLSASQLTDPHAVGTIRNSDPMPAAWITRFGRTVGSQVIDAVTSRFESATDSHVTVGGQRIGMSELFEGADTPVFEDLRQWAEGDENDRAEWRDEGRTVTSREILLGSSFHLYAGNGAEGGTAFAAWGEVATGGFEADVDDVRMDGEVTTGMIGIDAEWDQLLAGVMLSRSEGDGTYRLSAALGNDGGTVESSLTGVYPYLRLEMGEGVSAWGLAGYGTGSLTLRQDGQDPIETDLGMRMGAVGVRGIAEVAGEAGDARRADDSRPGPAIRDRGGEGHTARCALSPSCPLLGEARRVLPGRSQPVRAAQGTRGARRRPRRETYEAGGPPLRRGRWCRGAAGCPCAGGAFSAERHVQRAVIVGPAKGGNARPFFLMVAARATLLQYFGWTVCPSRHYRSCGTIHAKEAAPAGLSRRSEDRP